MTTIAAPVATTATTGAVPTHRRRRPESAGWHAVCHWEQLTPDRGVAALIDDEAVAVFRLGDGGLHAVGNVDPRSGASVLSRGLVGDCDGTPTIASPLSKERFDLTTGQCLDRADPDARIAVHDVRVEGPVIHVRLRRTGDR